MLAPYCRPIVSTCDRLVVSEVVSAWTHARLQYTQWLHLGSINVVTPFFQESNIRRLTDFRNRKTKPLVSSQRSRHPTTLPNLRLHFHVSVSARGNAWKYCPRTGPLNRRGWETKISRDFARRNAHMEMQPLMWTFQRAETLESIVLVPDQWTDAGERQRFCAFSRAETLTWKTSLRLRIHRSHFARVFPRSAIFFIVWSQWSADITMK